MDFIEEGGKSNTHTHTESGSLSGAKIISRREDYHVARKEENPRPVSRSRAQRKYRPVYRAILGVTRAIRHSARNFTSVGREVSIFFFARDPKEKPAETRTTNRINASDSRSEGERGIESFQFVVHRNAISAGRARALYDTRVSRRAEIRAAEL